MISVRRTNSNDNDFKSLVKLLDEELRILDGDDHAFYAQLNKTDNIDCVIAYINDKPVGCGAIRKYSDEAMEVKRMFTLNELRGKGIALAILGELEDWTKELGYIYCVLETGKRQPWAIALYKKAGYREIPNFGSYVNDLNSICFRKSVMQDQKIKTFLWFDNKSEEAANFYVSVFKDGKVDKVNKMPGGPGGTTTVVEFTLFGQKYIALDGGPMFRFNESVSLFVNCDTQEEVDDYWSKLTSNGGQESMCGWCKDKYGLSWQIVPKKMMELNSSPDREKAARAMQAMMTMKKIDLKKIEDAFNQ